MLMLVAASATLLVAVERLVPIELGGLLVTEAEFELLEAALLEVFMPSALLVVLPAVAVFSALLAVSTALVVPSTALV
jgi:hypothetical protein